MVDHAERIHALRQAVTIQGPDLKLCHDEAEFQAQNGKDQDFHAYLGGNVTDHFHGALGEMAFWNTMIRQGFAADYVSFNVCDIERDPEDLRHYDFIYTKPDGQAVTIDVKTGVLSFERARCVPLLKFGMLMPRDQARDGVHMADLFVYCILEDAQVPRVAVLGWCRWDTILARGVYCYENMKGNGRRPCVMVPMHYLRPMSELYSLFRMEKTIGKTENVREMSTCQ
jgi:hypothetical protein